ncbi:MAG: zf-HC2 domain-containing protein [Acidobacteriia bacterium]|nr:zf-HC2 domain-containing protein [Terriglobia bacterium]
MTIHPDFTDLLAYQDAELDPKNALKVAEHLTVCSGCRQEADQIQAEQERFVTLCREGSSPEVPPFAQVLETIRLQAAESGRVASQKRWHLWPSLAPNVTRSRVIGFALAVLFLMSFNTVVFTGLLLHPLYAAPEPSLVPVMVVCMLPAYFAARRAARRLTFTHKPL